MNVTPTFQGEFQFRRYSDTSTQGQQVVFAVADREALESFIGKEGKRFMAVLVQIGDDEQPVPPEPKERLGPYCYQAVKWCADPEFQRFMLTHLPRPRTSPPSDAKWAEIAVKQICGVDSRKEIDGNEHTKRMWRERIAGPYRKWRIARGLE